MEDREAKALRDRRVWVEPETDGMARLCVLTVDRYTPNAAQRRFLRARDQHCRFPGCVAPVSSTDMDHTRAWHQGGQTATNNLSLLCVVHHSLKHHQLYDAYRWEVTQDDDGILTWRSPLGAKFRDDPETGIIFQPVSGSFGLGSGHRGAHNGDDESESPPPF